MSNNIPRDSNNEITPHSHYWFRHIVTHKNTLLENQFPQSAVSMPFLYFSLQRWKKFEIMISIHSKLLISHCLFWIMNFYELWNFILPMVNFSHIQINSFGPHDTGVVKGSCPPPPPRVNRRVKKKVRDFSKPIHDFITLPLPFNYIQCGKMPFW